MAADRIAEGPQAGERQKDLEQKLGDFEAWRALGQLDSREAAGDWLEAVESGLLRQSLLRELSGYADFRAWAELVRPPGWPPDARADVEPAKVEPPPVATGPGLETFRTRVKLKIPKAQAVLLSADPGRSPMADDARGPAVLPSVGASAGVLPVVLAVPEDAEAMQPAIVPVPSRAWSEPPGRARAEDVAVTQRAESNPPHVVQAAAAPSGPRDGGALPIEVALAARMWPLQEAAAMLACADGGDTAALPAAIPGRERTVPSARSGPEVGEGAGAAAASLGRSEPSGLAGTGIQQAERAEASAVRVSRIENEVDALTRSPRGVRQARQEAAAEEDAAGEVMVAEADVQIVGPRARRLEASRNVREVLGASLDSDRRPAGFIVQGASHAAYRGETEEASVVIVRQAHAFERAGRTLAGSVPAARQTSVRRFLRALTSPQE